MLSSVYRYGDIAYIGGGFGVGIHNILEAATFGLPVLFGPNYKKFKEAVDLHKLRGAFEVKNTIHLHSALTSLITSPTNLQSASEVCKNYVAQNVGSTQRIINKVFSSGA